MPYANPEDAKAQDKAYYENNKEKIKARKKAYREKNREKIRSKDLKRNFDSNVQNQVL